MAKQLQFEAWPPNAQQEILAWMARAIADPALDEDQAQVLKILSTRLGGEQAIGAKEILAQAGAQPTVTKRRWLKGVIEDLVKLHGIPIGGRRGKPSGYFIVVTAADQEIAVGPLKCEIRALARRVRMLSGKEYLARLLGQLAMEFEQEKDAA